MASDRDDELGRTATAPLSAVSSPAPIAPLDPTLGRYRIDRQLGAGGMGVVHAAFDPDLERRVALKVLRSDAGEARQRLLREARAMARLAHPNVVTVHEVGSASGRDYVAMELVDGQTLAEWLRAAKRTPREIVEAFAAAGRGLAAAHAAGIVHRDFKPHNILRDRNGRIVVTDFGLARDAVDVGVTDPLAVTLAPGDTKDSGSSPLSGLTVTGSVLGTPAYMAPEQWAGASVTPASDQFAYCVALWEALAGERPFQGSTLEQLKDAVKRGPDALDDSKIPRRLRGVLRRGLDPDPKRRWPSMEALLAAMARAERRPGVALALGGAALVAGVVVFAAAGGFDSGAASRDVAAPGCAAPAIDPAAIEAEVAKLTARPVERATLLSELVAWRAARDKACGLPLAERSLQLTCLDAVLSRLETAAAGAAALPADVPALDAVAFTLAPSVCATTPPPQLARVSPQLRDVIVAGMRETATPGPTDLGAARRLVAGAGSEPCAQAAAHLVVVDALDNPADHEPHLAEAEQAAGRCRDERVRADVAIAVARSALAGRFLDTTVSSKVKLATSAVEPVAQPDLIAQIELLRMEVAIRADNLDEVIQRGEAAVAGFARRGRVLAQLRTGLHVLRFRELRSKPEDLVRIETAPREWRALAVKQVGEGHPIVRRLDAELAMRALRHGDASAYARLEALRYQEPLARARPLRGRVVDTAGRPVAGATVTAGLSLAGGSQSAAMPWPGHVESHRVTVSGADGTFALPEVAEAGKVIAQLGDRRSMPVEVPAAATDEVKLVLEPTSRIEGRVDLRGEPPTRVGLAVQDTRLKDVIYEVVAPLAPDGSFVLDGVPRSKVNVFVAIRGGNTRSVSVLPLEVRQPVVKNVRLAVDNERRVVHVLVRSTVGTPVPSAQVIVLAGVHRSMTGDKLDEASMRTFGFARQLEHEKAPPAVVAAARPGDLFVTLRDVPSGVATACGIGLPANLGDPMLQKQINANLSKIELRCVPMPPDRDVVVVEVPPWPRLD